jgi:formylglycine-generating enzyme required for sulfatase activity
MPAQAESRHAARELILPALLLVALVGLIAAETGALQLPSASAAAIAAPETVRITPRAFSYRDTGDYLRNGVAGDAPLIEVAAPPALEIMKYQVGLHDYQRCVAVAVCAPPDLRHRATGDLPVTGISFHDAQTYAAWLTGETGQVWRLPTAAEWAFAAGSRAVDDALGVADDSGNPADRWLARYLKEAASGGATIAAPQPVGSFGENEFGVADLGGSVWEWTSSCDGRTRLDAAGAVVSKLESCGVRILEGRHRTPMSTFIRDARSGGCAVGAPPDHLGFRLVRETAWYAPVLELLRRFVS